jgi:hypothetical protein
MAPTIAMPQPSLWRSRGMLARTDGAIRPEPASIASTTARAIRSDTGHLAPNTPTPGAPNAQSLSDDPYPWNDEATQG